MSSHVPAPLHALDGALLPATDGWPLQLLDIKEDVKEAPGVKVTMADIESCQDNNVGKTINIIPRTVLFYEVSVSPLTTSLIVDPRYA